MKEESRIEALEHELKILKNEIHTTLLEIREQILNHYYPELRAEEPLHHHSLPIRQSVSRPGAPAKSAPRAAEVSVSLSEIASKGQVQPFSDVFLEDLTDEDLADDDVVDVSIDDARIDALLSGRHIATLTPDEDYDDDDDLEEDDDDVLNDEDVKIQKIVPTPSDGPGVTPRTREVDFRQLKQTTVSQPTENGTLGRSTPMPTESPKASRTSFAALATWVSDGVGKVGKARTAQIVETYASGGKLTAETKSSLLQLISLAGEDEPAAAAGTQDMLAVMVGLDQILGQ